MPDDKMPWLQEPDPNDTPNPPKSDAKPNKHKGRFDMLNRFVDGEMRELSPVESCVWLVLYRDTKSNGTAQVSQSDIARRIGCSVRHVKRAVRGLVTRGYVQIIKSGDNISRSATIYRLKQVG